MYFRITCFRLLQPVLQPVKNEVSPVIVCNIFPTLFLQLDNFFCKGITRQICSNPRNIGANQYSGKTAETVEYTSALACGPEDSGFESHIPPHRTAGARLSRFSLSGPRFLAAYETSFRTSTKYKHRHFREIGSAFFVDFLHFSYTFLRYLQNQGRIKAIKNQQNRSFVHRADGSSVKAS